MFQLYYISRCKPRQQPNALQIAIIVSVVSQLTHNIGQRYKDFSYLC